MRGVVRSLSVTLAVALVAACATFNPIAQANTSQQKALAAYGTVTIMVEQIADLVKPGNTLPANVRAPLISAAERGGATAKAGLAAYNEAEAARVAFETGVAEEGRLNTAITSLDRWVTDAQPVIASLRAALRGAQ